MLREIRVHGFKSFRDDTTVELRPLTVLAGANSSGKSSLMQAVLLLKQTLDASYDPGPLKLDGPNVVFREADELLWRAPGKEKTTGFTVGFAFSEAPRFSVSFRRTDSAFTLESNTYVFAGVDFELREDMGAESIRKLLASLRESVKSTTWHLEPGSSEIPPQIVRTRFFFEIEGYPHGWWPPGKHNVSKLTAGMLHLAGLRGNPSRTYRVTSAGPDFPDLFHQYTASVLHAMNGNQRATLDRALQQLGLTWKVDVTSRNATELEVRVGRTIKAGQGGAKDLVNIADVGFGLSQVLPVLVALVAANEERLVYIEQPEIHLHPRAQVGLARVISEAVERGAHLVIETHSDLLLVALQRLVAEGALGRDKIVLHWFQRDKTGATKVTSANLDETGAYGKWPVDFGDVSLDLHRSYNEAAFSRLKPTDGDG